jgi:aspartate racemase
MVKHKNTKHIGIIGCSYEGAALCYKTVCNEGSDYLGEHAHPEVSLHTHPLSEYMEYINKNDWNGVAELMISSANKLTGIGAQILICPDNTIHQSLPIVKTAIATPWLHIAEEVLLESRKNNYKKVGVLGTRFLMDGPVYRQKCKELGLGYIIPGGEERKHINKIIFEELVYGIIKEDSKKYLSGAIDDLKLQGCDAVILGCTEIPLIISPNDSSLPTLDSTRILARAALKKSIGQQPSFA